MAILATGPHRSTRGIINELPIKEHDHFVEEYKQGIHIICAPVRLRRQPKTTLSVIGGEVAIEAMFEEVTSVKSPRLGTWIIKWKIDTERHLSGNATRSTIHQFALQMDRSRIVIDPITKR